MLAFGAVYLAGYFDLRDHDALTFWVKGIVTWSVHFAFLVCACAHVVRRGQALFIRCVWAFIAGMIVNCVYGIVQLALQVGAGVNLDTLVVGPLTAGQGKQGGIGVFGQVGGEKTVYRINALTGDPNHLGVMLCVPIFILLAWYLNDPRRRRWAAATLVLMLVVQMLTLSRSAALGDIVGLAVILPGLRGHLPSGAPARHRGGGRRGGRGRGVRVVDLRPDGHLGPHAALRERRPHPPPVLPARPARPRSQPALRDGLQHVRRLLRVPDRAHRLRPAQRVGRDPGRDRRRRVRALPRLLRRGSSPTRSASGSPPTPTSRGSAGGSRPGSSAPPRRTSSTSR